MMEQGPYRKNLPGSTPQIQITNVNRNTNTNINRNGNQWGCGTAVAIFIVVLIGASLYQKYPHASEALAGLVVLAIGASLITRNRKKQEMLSRSRIRAQQIRNSHYHGDRAHVHAGGDIPHDHEFPSVT
jgi:hypothetical protein